MRLKIEVKAGGEWRPVGAILLDADGNILRIETIQREIMEEWYEYEYDDLEKVQVRVQVRVGHVQVML